MTLPDNIRTAIDADLQDMLSWSILLNFFSEQQSQLSPALKFAIYEKCEEFRNFWNSDHLYTTEVIRNSGEVVKQNRVRPSLNIDKNAVYPDNIYTDKDVLDHLQTRIQNHNIHLAKDSDRDTDLFGEAPALAI